MDPEQLIEHISTNRFIQVAMTTNQKLDYCSSIFKGTQNRLQWLLFQELDCQYSDNLSDIGIIADWTQNGKMNLNSLWQIV